MSGVASTSSSGAPTGGERRQITVLFSDLTSYTTMSERLDPEELHEMMDAIWGAVSQVIMGYEGHVDQFLGDAVMAHFGIPRVHEDDAVRAVRAALDIHELVESMSEHYEDRLGQPLQMHTGVNTGLVVIRQGELDSDLVLGDMVNVASRLSDLAEPGEILVGEDTYRLAERHFTFDSLGPVRVKGRMEPVDVHKVLGPRATPVAVHRLSGMRAELVGRRSELERLEEAAGGLARGVGGVVTVSGEAGTGKSRLLEEFQARLDPDMFQWREGRAYAYASNVPYFPLTDLLRRAWDIHETDTSVEVRERIRANVERLLPREDDAAGYLDRLFALESTEIEGVDPESWKTRIYDVVPSLLAALARAGPTIVCLEDLHWADPSSVALLRHVITRHSMPALIVCTSRPPFSLTGGLQPGAIPGRHDAIELANLSASEAEDMVRSLLGSERIPSELARFLRDRAEGNPFHLEESLNALIESGILGHDDGDWEVHRRISEADVPLSVNGVLAARIDHLPAPAKQLLREASVIGRRFPRDVLSRVTTEPDTLDESLATLEQLDLVRTRSLEPQVEYKFKHALTQEVAYESILIRGRQQIHELIAETMEEVYGERLSEMCETIAFHFQRDHSPRRAAAYLAMSGKKAHRRNSLEEAHRYYQDAYELLLEEDQTSEKVREELADVLSEWMWVFLHRGDFSTANRLLETHLHLTEELEDRTRAALLLSWVGFAHNQQELPLEGYPYLMRALETGEAEGSDEVVARASTWLGLNCGDLGRTAEAVAHGKRAVELSRHLDDAALVYPLALAGLGYAGWVKGDRELVRETAERLIRYGEENSNSRSLTIGYWIDGCGRLVDGDFEGAIESNLRASRISADPWFAQFPRLFIGMGLIALGRYEEAGRALEELAEFCAESGGGYAGTPAQGFIATVRIADGEITEGVRELEGLSAVWVDTGCRWRYANAEYTLGRVYSMIATRSAPVNATTVARNLGFLMRSVPAAARLARQHLQSAAAEAEEIGADSMLGQAHHQLGRLHAHRGETELAREHLERAVEAFGTAGAATFLAEAERDLAVLDT